MSASNQVIWLIGGTGDVGRKTAKLLVRHSDADIVLAARNGIRAEAIARETGQSVRGVAFDATAPEALDEIPSDAILVNLTEATPAAFIAAHVSKGGILIESSASADYLADIEEASKGAEGLAVVNAGAAPGLTNILAREIYRRAPQTAEVELVIELGMGRHHGEAATYWTLNNMGSDYPLRLDGKEQRVKPGTLRREVRFASERRSVTTIGFGFSDQWAIARNFSLTSARSFLALDPPWMTHLLGFALRVGLGGWIARHARLLSGMLRGGPTFGRTGTRLLVEGVDGTGALVGRIELHTTDQAFVTAAMLAEAVHCAKDMKSKQGVLQFDVLLAFDRALKILTAVAPETIIYEKGTKVGACMIGQAQT